MKNNSKQNPQSFLWKCVRYTSVTLFADVVIIMTASFGLHRNLQHYFTFLTLLEGGLLFIAAGAVEWGHLFFTRIRKDARQPFDDSGSKRVSVASYLVIGAILFLISFLLSYPLS